MGQMIMTEDRIIDELNIIGRNIRKLRLEKDLGQTELSRILQLDGINITRETLVKIERGVQHIKLSQLQGIKKALDASYDQLLN